MAEHYTGFNGCLEEFFDEFEIACDYNGWHEKDWALIMGAFLEGAALGCHKCYYYEGMTYYDMCDVLQRELPCKCHREFYKQHDEEMLMGPSEECGQDVVVNVDDDASLLCSGREDEQGCLESSVEVDGDVGDDEERSSQECSHAEDEEPMEVFGNEHNEENKESERVKLLATRRPPGRLRLRRATVVRCGAVRRDGASRCVRRGAGRAPAELPGRPRRAGAAAPPRAPASACARLGRAAGPVRRSTLTDTRCYFCFCCRETKYSYRNDGKTEKTDVSIPVVAEQRAREDQGGPPRPEGDRGGQEGGRALALHGRQDHLGGEGGRGQGTVRARPGVLQRQRRSASSQEGAEERCGQGEAREGEPEQGEEGGVRGRGRRRGRRARQQRVSARARARARARAQ